MIGDLERLNSFMAGDGDEDTNDRLREQLGDPSSRASALLRAIGGKSARAFGEDALQRTEGSTSLEDSGGAPGSDTAGVVDGALPRAADGRCSGNQGLSRRLSAIAASTLVALGIGLYSSRKGRVDRQEQDRSAAERIDLAKPMTEEPGKGGVVLAKITAGRPAEGTRVRGVGPESVGDVEGAVDRVAIEILRQVEQGPTLVAWAFDASLSLEAERERLASHMEGVYAHIKGLDKASQGGGLLTAVVAFGQDRKVMAGPTADPAEVVSAIKAVPRDTSGVETTFGTVAEIVKKYCKFKDGEGHKYRLLIIVVTDEVGDDETRLEEAVATAKAGETPVYVLGSSAPFGEVEGRMNYTDPKTKQTFYNLPVRQGPESALPEVIRLPFWDDGPQYDDSLDAGFGPYALSRLTNETGGIYFVTRMWPGRVTFDPNHMREYHPDWGSKAAYEQSVARDPLRQAVLQAAQISRQTPPGQPSLHIPAADDPDFKEAVKRNQFIVARVEYTVKEALGPITSVARLRDRETSRRWQAHYDLIRGRLLAMRIRCNEFNTACAQMLRDQPKFKNPGSNTWKLVPSEEIRARDPQAKAVAAEAQRLLKRVVDEHPGTPWALLAKRELKDPFGFKWVEANVPPPPKRTDTARAKKIANPKGEIRKTAEPPES
jgi:hypothetical protein